MRRLALLLFLALAPAAARAETGPPPSAETLHPSKDDSAWWSHIKVLASDAFEGRLTGSPGYLKAADYVEGAFRAAGLRPGGTEGYLQPVEFETQTVHPEASRVALTRGGAETPLAVGPDLLLGTRYLEPKSVDAPLVFIGYGLHLPEAGYDDFAGVDLRGKIAVIMAGGPSSLSPALRSHGSSYALPRALEAAGAVGVISIPNPRSMDIPWARLISLSTQPGMRLADPALQPFHGELFSATINPERAAVLFAGSGRTIEELYARVWAHEALPRFPLFGVLKASVSASVSKISSPNVVGILPGSDPALAGQYVVISAHLDHLGVGEPIKGDRVYHGAMDNASGVASLIETAKAYKEKRLSPRRSLVFVAVCGEEKGLLGSQAFAEHPTVPRRAIVADINMDEFLPLFPLRHLLVLGEGESTLGALARTIARRDGYDTVPDPAPDRNIFVRSDQYSFIKTGVPSVALKIQAEPGSPEERLEKDWNTYRYHAPQDDLSQPVDLKAADDFDRYLLDLTLAVADEPEKPRWNEASFFRRFASPGL